MGLGKRDWDKEVMRFEDKLEKWYKDNSPLLPRYSIVFHRYYEYLEEELPETAFNKVIDDITKNYILAGEATTS